MGFYDIDGAPVTIAGAGNTAIDSETYENNLTPIVSETFDKSNADFLLSNCSVSANGLVCSAFSTAKYKYIANVYCERAVIKFACTSGLKVGLFLSSTLAVADAAGSLAIYNSYGQSENIPSSAVASESVSMAQGHEYTLELFRKGFDYSKAVLRDLESGEETTVVGESSNTRGSVALGISVFNGSATISKLIYETPLYSHAKVLIVGDSITWGGILTTYSDNYAYKLVTDYFRNDGVICAYGGDNISGGIEKATELFARGYRFDYVIMALGTNVNWDKSANWSYADQIAARRQTFANFKTLCEEYGATLLWCAPPANGSDDLSESLEQAEADTSTKGLPSRTILRKLIIDVFKEKCIRFDLATMTNGAYDSKYFADGLHTNSAGNQRQYDFAKSKLFLLGIR